MHILSQPPPLSPLPLLWVNHRLTMLSPLMEPSPPLWGKNWRGAASALFTLDLHFLRFGTGREFEGYSELRRSSTAFITGALWDAKRLNSRWQAGNPRCCRSTWTVLISDRYGTWIFQRELYFVNIIFQATEEKKLKHESKEKIISMSAGKSSTQLCCFILHFNVYTLWFYTLCIY